jgi:RimJ/RimL family protein N-acetyltransferase
MLKYYKPSDADIFKFRNRAEIRNIYARDPSYLQKLPEMCEGNVFTIWDGKTPVAICGWTISMYDNACLFMASSQALKARFNKEIMIDLKAVAERPKALYKRTECVVSGKNKINQRFIEFLGFHKESVLEKYDFNGDDMFLYAYIRED